MALPDVFMDLGEEQQSDVFSSGHHVGSMMVEASLDYGGVYGFSHCMATAVPF